MSVEVNEELNQECRLHSAPSTGRTEAGAKISNQSGEERPVWDCPCQAGAATAWKEATNVTITTGARVPGGADH